MHKPIGQFNAKGGQTLQRLIQENCLIEVLADMPRPTFPVHLIYLSHRHPSSVVKAFVDFCLQRHP